METTDVVVVGGGVIGLSIAYNLLKKNSSLKVTVLEKEMFVGTGSTAACTGGIRHQFSTRTNVELTLVSLPYFARFEKEMEYPVYFRQDGYLFVTARESQLESFQRDAALQNQLGAPTRILSREEIAQEFPYLETSDLLGGSFCPADGYADPYGVVQGYLQQAKKLGARVLTEEPVTAIHVTNGRVSGVTTPRREIFTEVVINAAGPYASEVAALAGAHIPVRPYRRQVFVAAPITQLDGPIPLTVDMDSGFYLHRELNGYLLLGGTDKDLAPGYSTAVDWRGFDRVAEAAVARIPVLEEVKVTKAYAGLRSLTPDFQAIFGETGEVRGLYCANGFTGHGFMHSPAIGLLMAELVLEGQTIVLDTGPLSPRRFLEDKRLVEANIF